MELLVPRQTMYYVAYCIYCFVRFVYTALANNVGLLLL